MKTTTSVHIKYQSNHFTHFIELDYINYRPTIYALNKFPNNG